MKKLKQTDGFRLAKLFLKRVTGKEPWLRPEVHLPVAECDGWAFCPSLIEPHAVIYSLGVGCDVGFDTEMIERFDAEVHAFDPTPSTATWIKTQQLPPGFHFYPWAVGGQDHTMRMVPRLKSNGRRSDIMYHQVADDAPSAEGEIDVVAKCLPTICDELSHDTISVLKMDIEGAEYDVIDNLLETSLRPTQLLVEFHHRHPGRNKSMTTDTIAQLSQAGYAIFSISSTGREFSFVSRNALPTNQESSLPA